jgi:hypothetical protein
MLLKHGEFAEVHRFIGWFLVPTALQNEKGFLASQSLVQNAGTTVGIHVGLCAPLNR